MGGFAQEGRLYPRDSDSENGDVLKVSSREPTGEGNKDSGKTVELRCEGIRINDQSNTVHLTDGALDYPCYP